MYILYILLMPGYSALHRTTKLICSAAISHSGSDKYINKMEQCCHLKKLLLYKNTLCCSLSRSLGVFRQVSGDREVELSKVMDDYQPSAPPLQSSEIYRAADYQA